jgi:hypothetical protein
MKRLTLVPLLVALLVTALPTGVAAAKPNVGTKTVRSDGAPLNDSTLTPEMEAELDRQTREKEEALGIGDRHDGVTANALNSYGLQTRSVTNYRQEKSYWCGPASARQTLGFHKKRSGSSKTLPSQTALANMMGTTTSGSVTTKIASALNSYDSIFGRVWYLASDIANTTNPYHTFVNRIGTQLRSITPNPTTPITLMQTKYIPRYAGHSSRHYMTISGIDDRTSPMKMRSVDPNITSKYYGIQWDNVGTTRNNGLCRACYQADLGGTNRAMAW